MKDHIKRCIYLIDQFNHIRLIAAILSLITLFIAVNTQNPINKDGILYLQTAEVFANNGWQEAMQHYPWPFYSILIAWLSKLTHLSFENSTYVLNAALLVIIVTSFISLIKELGGSRTVQFIGAFIILSHPKLHHYQHYIVRGFGYWAFSLLALLHFIRFYKYLKWRHALGWGIFIAAAILFRPEGLVFCCFGPLVLLFRKDTVLWSKLGNTLKAYSFNIITISIIIAWWLNMPNQDISQLGRLSEFWNQLQNGLILLSTNINEKAVIISQTVLHEYSKKWDLTMVISGLSGIYLYKLVETLWPVHTLLFGHAFRKKLMPAEKGIKKIIIYFTILNLVIPAIFLGQQFFVLNRFLIPASLLLLLWTPFSLHYFMQKWLDKKTVFKNNFAFPILSLAFLIMFVYAFIPPNQSKAYIVSAGTWLKQNMLQQSKLYANNSQLSYYAGKKFIEWDVSDTPTIPQWSSDDFVALKTHKNHYENITNKLLTLKLKPGKIFANKEGNMIAVFEFIKNK
ncbi:MAG: hypothetical protein HF982_04545 [Desulfobacteraceae bacterium]|nr:hypothetical protein [Desulfobacteraceae bacterium]MBC2718851.1 hypothetical protein [Desulfobacteraceae bacterium]